MATLVNWTRKKINAIYNAFNHTFKWLKTRKKEHLNAFLRLENRNASNA
jgi:hypothetical protein